MSVDLTTKSQHYLTEMLQTFVIIAIGIVSILMSKYFTMSNNFLGNGIIWGLVGYLATSIYVIFSDNKGLSINNKIKNFIRNITTPINLILIGCIWIFIGTLLTSKYQWSTHIVISYGLIAGYISTQLPS